MNIQQKTETVRARVTPALKRDVKDVLDPLGLSVSQAIVLFMSQIALKQRMPIELELPNAETRKTLDQADRGEGLTYAKDVDDLFEQIGL